MLILAADNPFTFPRHDKVGGDAPDTKDTTSYFQRRGGLLAGLKSRFRQHRHGAGCANPDTKFSGCESGDTDLNDCSSKQQNLQQKDLLRPRAAVRSDWTTPSAHTNHHLSTLDAHTATAAPLNFHAAAKVELPAKSSLPSALRSEKGRAAAVSSPVESFPQQPLHQQRVLQQRDKTTKQVRFTSFDGKSAPATMDVRVFHYKQTPLPDHVFVWAQREKTFSFLRRMTSSSEDTDDSTVAGEDEDFEEIRQVLLDTTPPHDSEPGSECDLSTADLKRVYASAKRPVIGPTAARLKVLRQCSRNVAPPRQQQKPSRSRSFAGSSREAFVSRIVML